MENAEEYSTENLHRCSYRLLQKTAKAMCLPSNVKKMYLIQLIHAKKFCSAEQVENLVRQVRAQRKHLALVRKRAKNKKKQMQQSTEISSTSNSKSPPITITPKRAGHIMIRYSPDQYSPPKPRVNRNITLGNTTINASDRVLRSFRSLRNPNYVLNNALIGIIKNSSSEESIKSIGQVTVSTENKYQQVNMTSLVRKQSLGWRNGNEIVPVLRQRSANISPQPMKRQRKLSGIYPLNEEIKTPIVSIRRADGTLSKLNAYIQKPFTRSYSERRERERSIIHDIDTIARDVPTSNISTNNYNAATISNITLDTNSESTLSFENNEDTISNMCKENQGDFTVYYHKKIRAEQVRSQRTKEMARSVSNECRLPMINDVFSKFNTVYERDVTQPIYVQVDTEPEMVRNQSFFPDMQNYQTTMLENLYNLKNVFIVNQPLLQITTTTNTQCVYSTPTISTAKAQPSANVCSYFNIASSQDSSHYGMEDPRVHDFFRNFRCDEALSDETTIDVRRSSSSDSLQSQDLGANVTIPEMVEDALELISQDGDYMERMGMDIRMQCILCEWAGPKIILEYHIRKEHRANIVQCCSASGECVVRYTLGGLVTPRAWLSRVLEHRQELYVLSAKYQDPDRFAATLTTLSNEDIPTTGSITTYNKVTGEPFTWQGLIEQLPSTLAYETDPGGLKLDLSRMDLLPNSANLKLMNRELVIKSPNKVVVGQPELDCIQIALIVKLFD